MRVSGGGEGEGGRCSLGEKGSIVIMVLYCVHFEATFLNGCLNHLIPTNIWSEQETLKSSRDEE